MSERVNKKRTIAELESSSSSSFHSTSNQSPLFQLPRPIFHIIFGEYLSLKNVARFDNVVLNRRDRMQYLSNLSNMVTRSFDGRVRSKFLLRWLFQRQIILSSLNLRCRDHDDRLKFKDSMFEIFPLNVSALESLILNNDPDPDLWKDHLLPSLRQCTKLKRFEISVESSDLFTIPNFYSGLERIHIRHYLTYDILSTIATGCLRLREISLGVCVRRSNSCLNDFINFLTLRGSGLKRIELTCYDREFEDIINLQVAKNCPGLEFVSIVCGMNDLMLTQLGSFCPLLKEVHIYDLPSCTDIGLIALAEGCRHLRALIIKNSSGYLCDITDQSIIKLSESCRLLESLRLQSLELTDESLSTIGRNCKHLKQLYLNDLDVSETGLTTLCASPNMKRLTKIELTDMYNFTDTALLELVKNSHLSLNSLSLQTCPEISDAGMLHISKYCKKLQEFNLSNNPSVTLPNYIADIIKRNLNLVEFSYALYQVPSNCIQDDNLEYSPMIMDALNANKERVKFY